MDEFVRKIAQDAGFPPPGPGLITGLDPMSEAIIRARTASAAKMRHLPPEVAYALTGEMPITESVETNVRLRQALERASDRFRALKKGLAHGLPGAIAGALLGNLISDSGTGTAIGAGLGGLAVGYPAYRAERKIQGRLAEELARLRTAFQAAQDAAAEQQLEAIQQAQGAAELQQMLAEQERPRRRTKKASLEAKLAGLVDDSSKPDAKDAIFDASDPYAHRRGKAVPFADRDREEILVDTPTYGEKIASAKEAWEMQRLFSKVHAVAEIQRGLEKGATIGVGVSGVGGPPAPSAPASGAGGGGGVAVQAGGIPKPAMPPPGRPAMTAPAASAAGGMRLPKVPAVRSTAPPTARGAVQFGSTGVTPKLQNQASGGAPGGGAGPGGAAGMVVAPVVPQAGTPLPAAEAQPPARRAPGAPPLGVQAPQGTPIQPPVVSPIVPPSVGMP